MDQTESAKNDQLIVPESVVKAYIKKDSATEEEEKDYQRAIEQINKRVDSKSYFNVELKRHLDNKRLIACLSRPSHHDIYGKNIRILVELLRFLSTRINNVPAILNKISKLKNFYGEDHYKFKNLKKIIENIA